MKTRAAFPGGSILRWLTALYLGISLGYLGLVVRAAVDGLLWRADFTAFYTGGTIVRQGLGPHLYDLALQTHVQQAILGPGRMFYDGVLPFNNPPYVALVMAPLTLLPLDLAFWWWAALQLGLLGILLRRGQALIPGWHPAERWTLVSGLLASFPVFLHFLYGSLTLWVLLCLVEWALALKEGKEFRAGLWLVLAAVKPQAILFPMLVLLAARRWRALAGAGAAGLAILGLTAATLGPSIWPDYLRWLVATSGYFDRLGIYPEAMYNLRGTLTLWLGAERAPLIQAVSMGALAAGAAVVLALWARARWAPREPGFDLRLAFTLVLGALLSPHQNPHDSLVLILPVVLFYDALRRAGRPTRAAIAFLLPWPMLFLLEEFALRGALGFRLPVLLMVILLGWVGIQYHRLQKSESGETG